jgi:hypothetical protein
MESVKPGAFQSHGIGGASAAPANGLRFSQLSAPRQTLVRLCQAINHGSIENLEVRSSEPVFNPLPVDSINCCDPTVASSALFPAPDGPERRIWRLRSYGSRGESGVVGSSSTEAL